MRDALYGPKHPLKVFTWIDTATSERCFCAAQVKADLTRALGFTERRLRDVKAVPDGKFPTPVAFAQENPGKVVVQPFFDTTGDVRVRETRG